jgi:single-strand DNA-binding protein
MNDLNRVFLIGRLVADIELKHTKSGTAIANFSIANNQTRTTGGEKKESVSFFNCLAWQKGAELLAQYGRKGNRIAIEGRLQQKSWTGNDNVKHYAIEIAIENFQFLDGKKTDTISEKASENKGTDQTPFADLPDDDIAF